MMLSTEDRQIRSLSASRCRARSEQLLPFFLGDAGQDEFPFVGGEMRERDLNRRAAIPERELARTRLHADRVFASRIVGRIGHVHVFGIYDSDSKVFPHWASSAPPMGAAWPV
jgi:hypothetical protein